MLLMAGFAARAQRRLVNDQIAFLADRLAAQGFEIKTERVGTNSSEPAYAHPDAVHLGINGCMFHDSPQETVDYRSFMHRGSVIQHVKTGESFSLERLAVVRVGNVNQVPRPLAQAPAVKICHAIFRYDILGVSPRRDHTRAGL